MSRTQITERVLGAPDPESADTATPEPVPSKKSGKPDAAKPVDHPEETP